MTNKTNTNTKANTKRNSKVQAAEAPAKEEAVTEEAIAEKVLRDCSGKFSELVVIGVNPNGQIDIVPTVARYDYLFELFSRAEFELLLHQKNKLEEAAAADNDEG